MSEIGNAIVASPQDTNVSRWKEFLMKPENLATALVLAAGVTGPRRQGQTKLNKALEAGVGALAFRGGLNRGLATQERQAATDEQQAAEAASVVDRRAATTRQQDRTLDIQQQSVDQAGQARPLTPEQSARIQAETDLIRRQTELAGTPTDERGVTGDPILDAFIRNAFESVLPGESPDITSAIAQAQQAKRLIEAMEGGGRLVVGEDGQTYLDVSEDVARSLGYVTGTVPTQQPDAPQTENERLQQTIARQRKLDSFRRRNPEFSELSDDDLETRVNVLNDAVSENTLGQLDNAVLHDALQNFTTLMPVDTIRAIRMELERRRLAQQAGMTSEERRRNREEQQRQITRELMLSGGQ